MENLNGVYPSTVEHNVGTFKNVGWFAKFLSPLQKNLSLWESSHNAYLSDLLDISDLSDILIPWSQIS